MIETILDTMAYLMIGYDVWGNEAEGREQEWDGGV